MKSHFNTYCSTNNLINIREFIGKCLADIYSLTDIDKDMIILAVDEICSNCIIHANNSNINNQINIECFVKNNQFVIDIIDKGMKMDFSEKFVENSINDLIKQRRRGGMGMMIVNKVMDEVKYTFENAQNIWHLSKSLNIFKAV